MSPLASTIYKQLVRHVRANKPSITYGELAAAISTRRPIHPRSPSYHAALGEVARACRAHALPCLPAIVWRAGTHQPSTGYFAVAHPRARTDRSRRAAWEREHAEVLRRSASYPATLGAP